jgi:calcineurin-like phosphoesterase family protein
MSQVFLAGCIHFGHNSMAVSRGFQDAECHDDFIIDNWNKVVHKRDMVYILGDITMENKKVYHKLDKLNGRKVVVMGNHDMKNHVSELLKHVESVAGCIKYKSYMLTHIPVHPMEFDYRINGNIHAHLHDLNVLKEDGTPDTRYVHVGMEKIDYTPVLFSDIDVTFKSINNLINKIY